MQYLFLDFETYYDDAYSLRRMTPLEYALDPRFEALGCGFTGLEDQRVWVDGPDLPAAFAGVDWDDVYAISHNALFDMTVLAYRYGVVPGKMGCTLSMARNQLSHKLQYLSLESLCKYYGMPAKWATLTRLKGIGFRQLQQLPELHAETRAYGIDDAAKCREIFARLLLGGFPPGELDTIDLVLRMVAKPQFELDANVLAEHLAAVKAKKQALLDAAFIEHDNVSSIMSDAQLASKLLFLGLKDIPRKISPVTGKEAYAFAKTDKEFQALLEHPEPMVQALVAARLGHKSTLEESRTERLLAISQFTSSMPIPLKYSGAHTHRFSGDWKLNEQNLPNDSDLRRAHVAPDGKVVVSVDASQIEARINAVLSQQWDLVENFRNGVDVYAKFAGEDIYRRPITKADKTERFVGKTGILSLGYGSSDVVFQNMCRVKGNVNLSDHESAMIVNIYRQRFRKIVDNWYFADKTVLPRIAMGESQIDDITRMIVGGQPPVNGSLVPWGPLIVQRNRIVLPNGNCLYYADLHQDIVGGRPQWLYKRANVTHKIYGAKLVENVVQALAFLIIMEAAKRIYEITRGMLWPAHQVHDELIYVVPDFQAEAVVQLVKHEMTRTPEWMPELPLAAEAHIGKNYGEC